MNKKTNVTGLEIAVVGMSGRFPNASNLKEYWSNLAQGKESIAFFTEEELAALPNKALVNNPQFVKCKGGVLENKEYFDANFFKYLPKEAELLAPQTRLFHECVWEAIEDAGYVVGNYNGQFGLYAGCSSGFLWEALTLFSGIDHEVNRFLVSILSGREFLCSQTSYKLNLTGPSVNVQTACSTSLVAINNACRALLTGECQVAIAGGVSASASFANTGYVYEEGMISSKDGHVRTFDKEATGAVSGEGVGVVILKLLKKAVKDGDNIHAVIKGAYINNDGDEKVGFTAPGVNGQAKVILSAIKMADVPAESITYVETHGTATALGDITEMEALKLAFNTEKRQYCGIGSVKTNIGHLDAAAGVAGFIKAVLCLKHKQLPPSLNFVTPNPNIDFDNSPFYVNTTLKEWNNNEYPLRAGVSSFGIGGTNAHVVLEEAPEKETARPDKQFHLLLLSAKTPSALEKMTHNLAAHLKENPGLPLADVAYTLQTGRKEFAYRKKILCEHMEQAIEILSDRDSRKIQTNKIKGEQHPVVFLFSGLGSQYVNMCKELYETAPVFKQELDACFEIVKKITAVDIKTFLYPGESESGGTDLHQIDTAQYMVFVIEYALAKLMMAWGIKPYAMIGYSFGEYVAACIAEVFSLEDAIKIIHKRGELIKQLPQGIMLSVPLSKQELLPLLNKEIALAIDNGPSCVITGPDEAVIAFEGIMKEKRLMCMRLSSTRAVHSHYMDPIASELEQFIRTIQLSSPKISYVSNVTGDWITAAAATDPAYWIKHLTNTVNFADGVNKLLKEDKNIYIEIGPGSDISTLVNRALESKGVEEKVINLVRPEANAVPDTRYLLNKLGQLWLYGVAIDWKNYYKEEKLYRVSLPAYPFERQRYWKLMDDYNAGKYNFKGNGSSSVSDWLYLPTWKRSSFVSNTANHYDLPPVVLLFIDETAVGKALVNAISNTGSKVIVVSKATVYLKLDSLNYQLNPATQQYYEQLFADLKKSGALPDQIIHLFSITTASTGELNAEILNASQDNGYYSVLNIAQALAALNIDKQIKLDVISNGILEVTGLEAIYPEKSTLLGPVKVIPQEFPTIQCRYTDIQPEGNSSLTRQLVTELSKNIDENNIRALRNNYTWLPDFESTLPAPAQQQQRLKENGVYLLTGGLGGIALALGKFLAVAVKAKLILVGRSAFPEKSEWASWLASHDEKDSTSEKITSLQEIEKLGAEVLILRADIADKIALQAALESAKAKFGKINGLVHTATVPDGAMIAVRSKAMSEALFSSKLYGTLILDELVNDNLDFVLYFSTLSSILGGFGQVAYCAANLFLDAFANYKLKRDGVYTVSINWDRWKNTGIARIGEKMHKELTHEELAGGMEVSEAIMCFEQILNYENVSQVAVSEQDLKFTIAQSKKLHDLNAADEDTSSGESEGLVLQRISRPDLSSDYIAPNNELELQLTQMWQNFFGIEKIGINDNFFELGGDSLKGMVLLKRMKKELNFDTGIKIFFVKPTVKQLAEEIAEVSALLQKKERSSKITV